MHTTAILSKQPQNMSASYQFEQIKLFYDVICAVAHEKQHPLKDAASIVKKNYFAFLAH